MALQNAHTIDLIAQDPATNDVVLGMTEIRPWDGSDRRVFELQEKVNAYLSFALDGEMAENFPQFAHMNIILRLDCVEEPDEKMNYFIGFIREQIGFQGISFLVNVVPELASALETEVQQGCGTGCGCAETVAHDHVLSMGGGCCGGGSCGDGDDPVHHGHPAHHHAHSENGCCGGSEESGGSEGHHHGGCGCRG